MPRKPKPRTVTLTLRGKRMSAAQVRGLVDGLNDAAKASAKIGRPPLPAGLLIMWESPQSPRFPAIPG